MNGSRVDLWLQRKIDSPPVTGKNWVETVYKAQRAQGRVGERRQEADVKSGANSPQSNLGLGKQAGLGWQARGFNLPGLAALAIATHRSAENIIGGHGDNERTAHAVGDLRRIIEGLAAIQGFREGVVNGVAKRWIKGFCAT